MCHKIMIQKSVREKNTSKNGDQKKKKNCNNNVFLSTVIRQ